VLNARRPRISHRYRDRAVLRWTGSGFDPYGDVTGRRRRRHSTDRPRFPIGAQCIPTSYLAPLMRYSGSKVDRKRFRPYGDVTDRNRRRRSKDRPRFPIGAVNAFRPRISHRYRDIAVRKWTGSGFRHTVTSRAGTDDANRYIDLGFLLVVLVCRPRISHLYRDVAVARWTGSSFGHTVTSQGETDAAIRYIDHGLL
jgi:hypothetical protein